MLPVGADLPTPTTGTDDAGTPAQGLADQITALALAGDPEERMQK
jgi:hypothetical protein